MTACTRVRLTGSIDVALPPVQAFTLFTPTGERAWAHGWDPEFPSPAADDTEPGVVFRTKHGDRVTTWTVIGSERPDSIQYAQATPGYRPESSGSAASCRRPGRERRSATTSPR